MWSHRFARWLHPRDVQAVEAEQVRQFLSGLATEHRLAASSQKQALNAIVFLLREALQKPIGDFSGFVTGRRYRKLPSILTLTERDQLFAALEGTMRLMAELQYGAGLRVTELLRLRIQDLDLERQHLTTFARTTPRWTAIERRQR